MSIDRLIQKILADADAEASRLDGEADETIETVKTETAKALTGIEKKAREDAATQAKEQKRRMISRSRAELRKDLLEEKQDLINQAFHKALQSIIELEDDRYSALMRGLLIESVESGEEEVIVASSDRGRPWGETLTEVNKDLSAKGLKGALTLSEETRSMAGGFVLRQGKREINGDLELLVMSLREELESDVAGVLFAEVQTAAT